MYQVRAINNQRRHSGSFINHYDNVNGDGVRKSPDRLGTKSGGRFQGQESLIDKPPACQSGVVSRDFGVGMLVGDQGEIPRTHVDFSPVELLDPVTSRVPHLLYSHYYYSSFSIILFL